MAKKKNRMAMNRGLKHMSSDGKNLLSAEWMYGQQMLVSW